MFTGESMLLCAGGWRVKVEILNYFVFFRHFYKKSKIIPPKKSKLASFRNFLAHNR